MSHKILSFEEFLIEKEEFTKRDEVRLKRREEREKNKNVYRAIKMGIGSASMGYGARQWAKEIKRSPNKAALAGVAAGAGLSALSSYIGDKINKKKLEALRKKKAAASKDKNKEKSKKE